jgi:hypothetical protein
MDGFCATAEEYLLPSHKRPLTGAGQNVLIWSNVSRYFIRFILSFKAFLNLRIILPSETLYLHNCNFQD